MPLALAVPWAAPLGPDLLLRADALGVILAALVGGVGVAVTVYAGGYLHGDRGLPRLLATILTFAAAMQLLAFADDPWLLFVAWELTSVTSYLLVLHTRTPESLRAATTALLVTGAGGLALLAGLVLAQDAAGVTRLSELGAAREALQASALFVPALLCIVAGCATKSALFPFHFWLPGAMAAPTPVSAYLHAATMVKAGIFLLARVHPGFGGSALWEGLVGGVGAATVVVACLRLPGSDDLKQMLAWSTVLALGTLALLLSLDSPEAALAVVVLILAHAAYKGTLFLTVGCIDHGTGTRLLPRLGGLAREMPWTAGAGVLGAASMMGLPCFAGFVAKEQVKLAGVGGDWLPSAALMLSAVALVTVAAWVGLFPFWRRVRDPELHPHEVGLDLRLPTLGLAVLGLGLGVGGAWLLTPLAERAAADLAGQAVTAGLSPLPATWSKALAAFAIVALGLGLSSQRRRLATLLGRLPQDVCARGWDAMMHALIAAGRSCVHVMQHGDLRGYLAVTLLAACALAAPALAELPFNRPTGAVPLWAWPVAALLAVGALVAAMAKSRLAAVAGMGAVGYGMALIFLGLGAPDLALTQVVVETLLVVLMVLAFRHLPAFTRETAAMRRPAGLVTAGLTGLIAAGLVLAATSEQLAPHLGAPLLAAAWERGLGANTVNVILVDIRALDTLGEITVLLLAAIGVSALVTPGHRPCEFIARSPILVAASRIILPVATLLAVFLLWRGHNQPGGGFIAGLCFAAGVVLVAAARGGAAARATLRLHPMVWAAGGLGLAVASGVVGMFLGGGFMHPHWWGKIGTPLFFDLGVFVLVVGISVLVVERMLEAEEGSL